MKPQKNKFKFVDLKKLAAFCGLFFVAVMALWYVRYETMSARTLSAVQLTPAPGDYHFVDDEALAVNDLLPTDPNDSQGAVLGARTVARSGVPVLMYHHVGPLPEKPDPIRRDLTVSAADFEKQMQSLEAAGYTAITAEQLQKSYSGTYNLPAKPIVITFDDGYTDVFEYAVPVLLQHRLVGSFAVITQYVGTSEYASWELIANAHAKGMEIISHSRHHIDFTNPKYTSEQKFAELQGARRDLHDNLRIDTTVLVYPYGHVDAVTKDLARKAGYTLAFTTKYGNATDTADKLLEPRVRVHGVETIQRFNELLGISTKLK